MDTYGLVPGGCSAAGLDDHAVSVERAEEPLRFFAYGQNAPLIFASRQIGANSPGKGPGGKEASTDFPGNGQTDAMKSFSEMQDFGARRLIKRGIYVTMEKHKRERGVWR